MAAGTAVAAFGLKPVRHLTGGRFRTHQYSIASNYTTTIFNGDPVIYAAGKVQVATSTTAGKFLGVFMGCFYTDLGAATGGPRFSNYWPGSAAGSSPTDALAIIADDPETVFQVYADPGNTIAQTANSLNVTYIIGSGVARTGVSALTIDSSSPATTTNFPFRVVDRARTPGNDWGTTGVSIGGVAQGLLLEVIWNPTAHVYQQNTGV